MKNTISGIMIFIVGVYLFSFVVFTPYFNWQYAKHHGFVKWVFLGEIVATGKSLIWPYYMFAAGDATSEQPTSKGNISEYTDNEYGYVFQYSSDWNMISTPQKGEGGEVRVLMKGPNSTMLMVLVGKLENPLVKRLFDANPNSDTIVDSMIDFTIESVYKNTSREIGASRMVVGEKRAVPSGIGIKFFVSTAQFVKTETGEIRMAVSGIHYIPFEKKHMISFVMIGPFDSNAKLENEASTTIFNSFHLLGEATL